MKRLVYILLLLTLTVSVGCKRLPLYDETGRLFLQIEIDYDIHHTPDPQKPSTMRVLFFDPSVGHHLTHDFVGAEGGEIYTDAGKYDIVLYNFNTEWTRLRGLDHIQTAEAYTGDADASVRALFNSVLNKQADKLQQLQQQGALSQPVAPSSITRPTPDEIRTFGDDPIIKQPDHLFVGSLNDVDVPVRVDGDEVVTLYAKACTILETYKIEVRNVTGAENIGSVDVFLTGQVRSNFFGRCEGGERSSQSATLFFPLSVDGTNNMFTGTFNTFGKFPDDDKKSFLNVLVTDTGGGQYLYQYDVTAQFENPDHVIRIQDEIDIPKPEQGGGGFHPTVSDWNEERNDIVIG